MSHILIPEIVVPGKPLGRHQHVLADATAPAPVAPLAAKVVSVVHASAPGSMPLNQANVGGCTAFSEIGALNCVPHWRAGNPFLGNADALKLYGRETADEGQPYPPNDPGGTGPAVCQAGIELGLLSGFQAAYNIDQALRALVLRPAITGINWYTSFDSPSSAGLVEILPGATVRGGHEIVAFKIDVVNRLVWFWQSWGLTFGLNAGGTFCMSFDTWDRLQREGGDVTVPRTAKGWVAP